MPKHARKLHTAGKVKGEDAGMGIALLEILCYQNQTILDRKKIAFFSSPSSSEKESDCNIFSSIIACFWLKIFLAEFQVSCEMHPGLLITVTKDTQRFNAVFAELGVMAVRLS